MRFKIFDVGEIVQFKSEIIFYYFYFGFGLEFYLLVNLVSIYRRDSLFYGRIEWKHNLNCNNKINKTKQCNNTITFLSKILQFIRH